MIKLRCYRGHDWEIDPAFTGSWQFRIWICPECGKGVLGKIGYERAREECRTAAKQHKEKR